MAVVKSIVLVANLTVGVLWLKLFLRCSYIVNHDPHVVVL